MKCSSENYKNENSIQRKTYKQIVILMIAFLGFIGAGYAQEISQNALGLRFGGNDGFGAEISYQYKLSGSNRLEFDLGFRDNNNFNIWKVSALHQWVWSIDGAFNWYSGFGGGIGSINIKNFDDGDGLFVNAAGNIGVEYNFDFPLLVSLDFRPEVGLVNGFGGNDLDLDIALGVRYQF